MTESWEAMPNSASELSRRPDSDSTSEIMAHVLGITRLRQADAERRAREAQLAAAQAAREAQLAAEQQARRERLDATDEVDTLINGLVDKLERLNYPLATIVKVAPEGRRPEDCREEVLEDTALWLLDVSDKQGPEFKPWAFGADRRLYKLWVVWDDGGDEQNKKYSSLFYAPRDTTGEDGLPEAVAVRDALKRFEVPAEDPQAELFIRDPLR